MGWYINGTENTGFDGSRGNGAFEPVIINPNGGGELAAGYFHYLYWNTNDGPAGEQVTRTGQFIRLLDVMEAVVLRETWPKTGGGYTGIYLWNSAGLSQSGAGLSGVERAGIAVDEFGPSIGSTDITGYYLPNAMTLVTTQGVATESRDRIIQFLMKCRAAMLRYSATWTV